MTLADDPMLPDFQVSGHSDKTIFLLHGLFGSKEYWRFHTARLLAQGYRVVAWDAPGYGLSSLRSTTSLSAMAAVQAALIRATGTRINIVHGHSMGGQLTPKVCSLVPELVSAAVIVATIGYFGNRTPEEQAAFLRERASAAGSGAGKSSGQVVQDLFGPGASGEEVALVRDVGGRTSPATVKAYLEAIRTYPEAEAVHALRSLQVPTLLVAGGVDKTGDPAGMKRLQALLPRSEFAVVEGSGHYPWAEKPDEFNRHLSGFLQRHLG